MGLNAVAYANEEPEKIEITKRVNNNKQEERTIQNYTVDAYLYRTSSALTVELFNIGTATITVMNSAGVIVSTSSTDTAVPVTLNLPLPGEDSYFIEIISTRYYASGFFNL